MSCAIISMTTEFRMRFLYRAASSSSCMSLVAQKITRIISPAEIMPCIQMLRVFIVSITHLLCEYALGKRGNVDRLEHGVSKMTIAAGGNKKLPEDFRHGHCRHHAGYSPHDIL